MRSALEIEHRFAIGDRLTFGDSTAPVWAVAGLKVSDVNGGPAYDLRAVDGPEPGRRVISNIASVDRLAHTAPPSADVIYTITIEQTGDGEDYTGLVATHLRKALEGFTLDDTLAVTVSSNLGEIRDFVIAPTVVKV